MIGNKYLNLFLIGLLNYSVLLLESCVNPQTINDKKFESIGTILKTKTGIEINRESILINYNNDGVNGDYTESYDIRLSEKDFVSAINIIKISPEWKRIEKGYQKLIRPRFDNDTMFIFQIGKDDKILIIHFILE